MRAPPVSAALSPRASIWSPMPRKRSRRIRLDSSPLSILGQKSGFMTCRERAEAAGISIHTLRHLERGSFLPGPEIIDMLAKAYNQPVAAVERACGLTRENLLRKELERARYLR